MKFLNPANNLKHKRKINVSSYSYTALAAYKELKAKRTNYMEDRDEYIEIAKRLIGLYDVDRFKALKKVLGITYKEYNNMLPEYVKDLEIKCMEANSMKALMDEATNNIEIDEKDK